jgi:uncharacterized protein
MGFIKSQRVISPASCGQGRKRRDLSRGLFISGHRFYGRPWVYFAMVWLGFLIVGPEVPLLLPKEMDDPMIQREERLKALRKERDLFFREDASSPLKRSDRQEFKGLFYYPIDLRYAMIGAIGRYPAEPKPLYVTLPTNREMGKKYVKYGRFKFKWEGKEHVLQIYRPLGGGEPFLPFKDKTSGVETFLKGRYLKIEPMPDGEVLIDFNRAYNPFCQYNEKYTCPFAPEENRLEIEIRAGEKRFP